MMEQYKTMEQLMAESDQQRYRIDNLQKAESAIRKIREAQADTQKWEDHFANQLEGIRNSNQSAVGYYSSLLEEFFDTLPKKETKTQESYMLPGAKLVRAKESVKYNRDEGTLLEYFKNNEMGEYIKVKESPDWAAYKSKTIQDGAELLDVETGEVVQGVTLEVVPPRFSVKLEG